MESKSDYLDNLEMSVDWLVAEAKRLCDQYDSPSATKKTKADILKIADELYIRLQQVSRDLENYKNQ